ncbi:MAG: NAD(P)/FAD-dependent oxidoreductase [Thermomicrobiales bacterium]
MDGAAAGALADPFRHPAALVRDLTTSVIPLSDKLRLARWPSAAEAAGAPANDLPACVALEAAGLSARFVDRFARPFWGGIALDPSLAFSTGPMLFTLKMFLPGRAVLPSGGMQAVPEALAGRLPSGVVRLNQPVEQIVTERNHVTGVRVAGETMPASAVVVATDALAARDLTGITAIPEAGVGCVTVYLTGTRDPGIGRRLVLDGTGTLAVANLAALSTVVPSYAPAGRHLLATVMLGEGPLAEPDDEKLSQIAREEAALMLGHDPSDWASLAVVRIPFSLFAQPPGIFGRLPGNRTGATGLYLAGEYTVDASKNGAMLSGEAAARAVLET